MPSISLNQCLKYFHQNCEKITSATQNYPCSLIYEYILTIYLNNKEKQAFFTHSLISESHVDIFELPVFCAFHSPVRIWLWTKFHIIRVLQLQTEHMYTLHTSMILTCNIWLDIYIINYHYFIYEYTIIPNVISYIPFSYIFHGTILWLFPCTYKLD